MARVRSQLFRNISGKMWDVVFRQIKGKTFITSAPKKYNFSKSDAAVGARNNFSVAVSFAKCVNSIPEFKKIWSDGKLKGANSYSRLISANSKLISDGKLSQRNVILPRNLSDLVLKVSLEVDKILVKLKAPSTGKLHLIIAIRKNEESDYQFLHKSHSIESGQLEIIFDLTAEEISMFVSSHESFIYPAVL